MLSDQQPDDGLIRRAKEYAESINRLNLYPFDLIHFHLKEMELQNKEVKDVE
jgi:hypothetical protein